MTGFAYRDGVLHADAIALDTIASEFGTPCYVYSEAQLIANARVYLDALGDRGRVFYAVKANSNLSVLAVLRRTGCDFDIVSGGELERVLRIGEGKNVVFSGIGKQSDELQRAMAADIACFNLESRSELALLSQLCRNTDAEVPVAVRINPISAAVVIAISALAGPGTSLVSTSPRHLISVDRLSVLQD